MCHGLICVCKKVLKSQSEKNTKNKGHHDPLVLFMFLSVDCQHVVLELWTNLNNVNIVFLSFIFRALVLVLILMILGI